MDFETTVDLLEAKRFVESPDFAQYLLTHIQDFGTAAFILQTLLDAIDTAARTVDNE